MREITKQDVEMLDFIRNPSSDIALVSSEIDGEDVTIIASIEQDSENNGDGEYSITPLAILILPENEKLFEKLKDPTEE